MPWLRAITFLSAVGHTKGSLVQVNLTAEIPTLRSVEEFRNLVVRQSGDTLVRLRDIADVGNWEPKITTPRCASAANER